jgi:ATP-dependent DNA helicase RecG
MNRLIQGDVGAGKTIVSIGAMLMAVDAGAQAAMMAPTEILAEQHHATLQRWLSPLGIRLRLLKGGQSGRLREDVLTDLMTDPLHGGVHIVVGTHAIIQDQVRFARLGLAVIDEQHRFGVEQRSRMLAKGSHPHLLVMSATPIPRSLALSLYSDLDITAVKGLPAGRRPIRTAIRNESNRGDLYAFVRKQLDEGGQAYVVYPLVEESEALDLKDATAGFDQLSKEFPEIGIGLIHGRLKSEEKDDVMSRFSSGELRILVSTTVIEVGVDVPNASIMIIEHAERFGLSQLHQLRGRVGRGTRESYCVLMHGAPLSASARFRLRKMAETSDGFEIAEADLKLRGPGDFLGTRQSGLPEFRFGDIVEDQALLLQSKDLAWELMERDPDLESHGNQDFKAHFEPYFSSRMAFFGK